MSDKPQWYTESVSQYRGYRITANDTGYSVYKGGACVACGGITWGGEEANRAEAKLAVRQIIEGKRKPLSA